MDEDTRFEEFQDLIKELSEVKGKLLKLEERKNTVREAVYERVRSDYEEKVRQVEAQIEEKRDFLENAFSTARSEIEDVVNRRKGVEEEVEEISLRHYLGEYEDEEYERLHQDRIDMLGSLMKEMETLTKRVNFLKEFLPDSMLETLPEEALASIPHEEMPSETESLTEGETARDEVGVKEVVTEAAAEQEISEETALKESAEEEGVEERIGVESDESERREAEVEEEPEVGTGEMLSREEAEAIIEDRIYPAEETSDIMKQPELAPEAKEKEGVECPKCGLRNEPDSWYCEKCGAQLLEEGAG